MRPNEPERCVTSSPVVESATYGISYKDEAHLLNILRDTLYTDRILAVLREYGANAWDAHRDAGKAGVPIKVTLPTDDELTLSIRDYGKGLSPEDVFTVYTQYGASTKRGSDLAVGMLGIGCKSAFAYADSFTVTSWHGGEKRIYAAALDVTNKGVMNLLHTEACGYETGVEIKLAIKREDRWEFSSKAADLYKYFKPRPIINEPLPPLPGGTPLKNGLIGRGRESWVAVMGCIAYRVNLSQLGEDVLPALREHHGELYFNIGDVTVSASREELKYSKETKAALVQKFADLVDEYISTTLAEIRGTEGTQWSRRIKAQELRGLLTSIPTEDHGLLAAGLPLKDKVPGKAHVIKADGKSTENLYVEITTRLIIRDTRKRSLKGYGLRQYDYIFEGTDAELKTFLAGLSIDGIPTVKLSELEWHSTSNRKKSDIAQHKQHCFVLNTPPGDATYFSLSGNGSENWTGVSRTPLDTDIFVVLVAFHAIGHSYFGHTVNKDRRIAKRFGVPFPDVYGYKDTQSKPVSEHNCKGTPYNVWRKAWLTSLITPEFIEQTRTREVALAFESKEAAYRFREGFSTNWPAISEGLGPTHPIVEALSCYAEGRVSDESRDEVGGMTELYAHAKPLITDDVTTPAAKGRELLMKYPLLYDWSTLWKHTGRVPAWIEYIKLKDAQ